MLLKRKPRESELQLASAAIMHYFESRLIEERRWYQDRLNALQFGHVAIEKALDRLDEEMSMFLGRLPRSLRKEMIAHYRAEKPKMINVSPKGRKGG